MKKILFVLLATLVVISLCLAKSGNIATAPSVAEKIELLDTWIRAQMEYRSLPGLSIAVVYNQQIVWTNGYGTANLEAGRPMETNTIFRIASITKLFTSTAIMQLRDQGKLKLDDPIRKYLKWFEIKNKFENAPEVTIRQLLTHSSGLPREAAFPYWTDHVFPSIDQMIEKLPDQEMIFEPETKWKYSNLGMALLGEIVAVVSGMSYEDYIQEKILEPLKMKSTSVNLSAEHKKRLTVGYGRKKADGSRDIVSFTDSKGLTPAANMSSTVEDLAKFVSFQFLEDGNAAQNKLLKGSTLREMHRVHWLRPGWKSGWGLGFSIRKSKDRVLTGHGGWVGGYRTQLLMSIKEKVGVIVMTNTDDGIPNFYATRALELLTPTILDVAAPEKPEPEFKPAWEKYVGIYHDPWGWDTKIMRLKNKLVMYGYDYPPEDNPEESITELEPVAEHTFRRGGESGNGELVVFEMDKDGKIVRVKTGENYIYPADQKQ